MKHLLAFSAGVDSTALFFMLLEEGVEFDIAIVDYGIREQSKDEVAYAKELASQYNKKVFVKEVQLDSSNFEASARKVRYDFFEELIKLHGYTTLITAHQLNDQLEWFLMQLSKGAGLKELIGLHKITKRDGYEIHRPILDYTKDELLKYLHQRDIKYFVDSSNIDTKYKRNYFRSKFANELISEFSNGIKKSFEYLRADLKVIYDEEKIEEYRLQELVLFRYDGDFNMALRIIDNELKKRKIILSSLQKKEILKQKEIIIKNLFSITLQDNLIWICPKNDMILDKKFKELCRVNKIPKNTRAYLKYLGVNNETILSIGNGTLFKHTSKCIKN
ncbi:tRNA lysidine(34) synthetase TilS [Arcobacter sp. FWKO B]|uniref:tRNA lysidine(34) synthetase TilS n=1 Tax=Arcobacter sp. FWKO B TaxID=2593672 RepID=UPI0018A44297|nr:tRNA lysidine(34) synthetase TilS [Arcobacter sp. FWKO B]QOG11588.1 tRNA lysidine(34) synthetase TilS [Arcobacter sp. FWKO B]